MNKLEELYQETKNCNACKLCTTRTNYVFGSGSVDADIMLIGEAPGKDEDLQGEPFIGKSGKVLRSFLNECSSKKGIKYYACNIVKCRPTLEMKGTKDRKPTKEEIKSCCSIIIKQIEIIKPKVIVTLGNVATQFLLGTKKGISEMRGKEEKYKEITVIPVYHPSYIVRKGGLGTVFAKEAIEDLFMAINIAERIKNEEEILD